MVKYLEWKEKERKEAPIEESEEEIQIIFQNIDNVVEKVYEDKKGREKKEKKEKKRHKKKFNIEDDDDDGEETSRQSSNCPSHRTQDISDKVLQNSESEDYKLNRNENPFQPSTSQQYTAVSPPRNRLL